MELDQIFLEFAMAQGTSGTMIACLYTGSHFPSYCAPMPRNPEPNVDILLDKNLHSQLARSIEINPSVHDGAIMIGRRSVSHPYKILGWSFRLFAPDQSKTPLVNRGSAFNSCFAIAQTSDIDRVYLHSAGQMHMFRKGEHKIIYG